MRVDEIFEGGALLTMDPARPRATARAVLGGRIVAVGDGDELRRHLDAERVVSLQGRTVVPGFHDAHNHMPWWWQVGPVLRKATSCIFRCVLIDLPRGPSGRARSLSEKPT